VAPPALDPAIDVGHRKFVEQLLAVTRLLAAAVILIVMRAGSGPFHPPEAELLTAAYVVYASAVLLAVGLRPPATMSGTTALHVVDFAWAAAITGMSGGTSSNAFPLYGFVLVAAAYRWGLARTLVDGAVVVGVTSALAVVAASGHARWPFELDLFVLRVSYIAVLAVLFGLLSERQHLLSFQSIALGQVMTRVGQASGLETALRGVLQQFLRLFRARRVLLVSQELDGNSAFLWSAEPRPGAYPIVSHDELSAADRDAFFFPVPPLARTWEYRRTRNGCPASARFALDVDGGVIAPPLSISEKLTNDWTWTSLTVTVTDVPGCWTGRLFLLDAVRPPRLERRLRFLQSLLQQVTPALANLYLLRRLRSRAQARERAFLARELHDGVIQSLAALEMQLGLVSLRAKVNPALSDELTSARDRLHEETLNVRELMQRLRPIDADARRLPSELRDLIDRFSRMSGIQAELDWAAGTFDLTPRQCRELYRIVQEALANVRRHSGASRVLVRVRADASSWELIVEDNGRGFGFTGGLTHEELSARKEGPRVIRERVESLGGSLALTSSPVSARLEIVFPRPHLYV
jgi:signal transduction histidine kinase